MDAVYALVYLVNTVSKECSAIIPASVVDGVLAEADLFHIVQILRHGIGIPIDLAVDLFDDNGNDKGVQHS